MGIEKKGSENILSTAFVYNFSRKIFLMLYSINWPNLIVWLLLLVEILGNMCIAIVYFPDCDVKINFEIKLIFQIKPFFYTTKRSRQKFQYIENEKSFWGGIKKHFSSLLNVYPLEKIASSWECAFKTYWKMVSAAKNLEGLQTKSK